MTELSDYRRMIEKPMLAADAAEINRLREGLLEIVHACERAAHPAAPICLSEPHLDHLVQIANRARYILSGG